MKSLSLGPLQEGDIELAMAGTGIAPGAEAAARLDDFVRRYPGHVIRISQVDAAAILEERAELLSLARRLGADLEFWHANVELGRNARDPRLPKCEHCRFFDPARATDAHQPVAKQAIIMEAGTCRYMPPMALVRGTGPIVASYFPPVHPDQGCGRFEDRFGTREDE